MTQNENFKKMFQCLLKEDTYQWYTMGIENILIKLMLFLCLNSTIIAIITRNNCEQNGQWSNV